MIRNAEELDAKPVVEIYNYYIRNSVATFEEVELTSEEMGERIKEKQEVGHSWLVALKDERVVGYAYSGPWSGRSAYRNTCEVSVYLSPTDLSEGWGTKLYTALFSRLQKMGVHVVIGGITLPNRSSIALHEKFGMTKVAHFKEVGYKFGQWLDVGYWQVLLND